MAQSPLPEVISCTENSPRAGLPKLVNPETGRVHNVSPHRLRDAFAVHTVKLDDSGDGFRLLQEHLGHRASTPPLSTEKYLAKNIRNGIASCGTRKIDRYIFYSRGEAK